MALKKKGTGSNSRAEETRQYTRDCLGLSQALKDNDEATRRWAAKDLSAFADAVPVLLEQLKEEKERSVREALIASLTEIGSKSALDALVWCLRSEDVYLRNEAIEGLKLMPDVIAPIMQSLLSDEDSDVRIFAVNILESLRHAEVENWLIKVIKTDPHINVCATAVDLLVEVGSEDAVAALNELKARFSSEPYIGFTVDLAIKRICGD